MGVSGQRMRCRFNVATSRVAVSIQALIGLVFSKFAVPIHALTFPSFRSLLIHPCPGGNMLFTRCALVTALLTTLVPPAVAQSWPEPVSYTHLTLPTKA